MAGHRQKRYRSNEIRVERVVHGQRLAAEAWRLFWLVYYLPQAVEGPELWRGHVLVMRASPERWKDPAELN